MESSGLTLVVVQLLAALHGLTGHEVPAHIPVVAFVPQATLAEMACGRPCEVRAWYGGARIVYLDDRLSPETRLWDRGILLHELVHYMQEQEGAFGITPSCERWLEREDEAYDAQARWLMANRAAGNNVPLPRFPRLRVKCES